VLSHLIGLLDNHDNLEDIPAGLPGIIDRLTHILISRNSDDVTIIINPAEEEGATAILRLQSREQLRHRAADGRERRGRRGGEAHAAQLVAMGNLQGETVVGGHFYEGGGEGGG